MDHVARKSAFGVDVSTYGSNQSAQLEILARKVKLCVESLATILSGERIYSN